MLFLHLGFAPILSPSMQPALAPGDLALTRTVPATAVAVGDVVVLPCPDAPGERYAHRVVAVTRSDGQPVVRTQGDANEAADPQALRITSTTVPIVIGQVPAVGTLALWGTHTWVRIAVILFVGPCVLVAAKRALWDRT